MADEQNQAAAEQQPQQAPISIQRIYAKDISFETPNSPAIFNEKWEPEVKLDLDTKNNTLGNNLHEVVLSVTVTVKVGEKVAFLCEVQQAGIFYIADMPEPNVKAVIGTFCPNTLFPYARETISSLVNRGTFPAFNLAPVNFDAIFQAYMQQQAQEEAQKKDQLDA